MILPEQPKPESDFTPYEVTLARENWFRQTDVDWDLPTCLAKIHQLTGALAAYRSLGEYYTPEQTKSFREALISDLVTLIEYLFRFSKNPLFSSEKTGFTQDFDHAFASLWSALATTFDDRTIVYEALVRLNDLVYQRIITLTGVEKMLSQVLLKKLTEPVIPGDLTIFDLLQQYQPDDSNQP